MVAVDRRSNNPSGASPSPERGEELSTTSAPSSGSSLVAEHLERVRERGLSNASFRGERIEDILRATSEDRRASTSGANAPTEDVMSVLRKLGVPSTNPDRPASNGASEHVDSLPKPVAPAPQPSVISLEGRRSVTKEEAFQSQPTAVGNRLAQALLSRPGVGNDFSYDKATDGRCLEKVNDAMDAAGVSIRRVPLARQAADVLAKSNDYIEVKGPISASDLNKFPVGTVCIAQRASNPSAAGHAMVKVSDEGQHQWCSDFRHPPVVYSGGYSNIRVFIPKGDATVLALKGGDGQTATANRGQPTGAAPVSAADALEDARAGRASAPKLGDQGPEVALLKARLNWVREQSQELKEIIPPVSKGDVYDPSVSRAFERLRAEVGVTTSQDPQANGRADLNLINAIVQKHHTSPQNFPSDPATEQKVRERGL